MSKHSQRRAANSANRRLQQTQGEWLKSLVDMLRCRTCGRRAFTLVDEQCEACRKISLDTTDDI